MIRNQRPSNWSLEYIFSSSFPWSLVFIFMAVPIVGYLISVWAAEPAQSAVPTSQGVRVALATRLPKTKITDVRCDRLNGLCEVTAGTTLFYTDAKARYLVIGRVYDMETRSDLTAARLLELNPETLLSAAAHKADAGERQDQGRAVQRTVALSQLPKSGAIHWGPAGGPRVVVFTDFRCGYCMRLNQELTALGARVEERPISVLGSRSLTEKVYCSKNPASALRAAYVHDADLLDAPKCDTSGLDANEAFAKQNGFTGTPVVVRPDGQVLEGFRPAAEIAAWLKAGRGAA